MLKEHRLNGAALCLGALALVGQIQPACSAQPEPRIRPWNEYRTIMWIGDSANRHPEKLQLFFQRLREMGINTAMVYGEADPTSVVANHFAYYVENMVNRGLCLKFNSKVTDWDKTVTDWARHGRPESELVRDYCLDDPAWRDLARKSVEIVVRKNAPHHPLAYNIRDELSTTISANPFDYDFNPIALEAFRSWLRSQYRDLAELNAQWDTRFASWQEVTPFTTDQVKNRMASGEAVPRGRPEWQQVQQIRFALESARQNSANWNFSPWADFRSYMDASLARALDDLRRVAHRLDRETPVGIEGTQMPAAFGGYDLWRLSQVLDWVEPYDIGCAREILGSFMPNKPILTTVFESARAPAQRRLWHLLLEGDRGCLVWWSEDCLDWAAPDWPLTAKAKALAPVLREMASPLASLFLRAEPEHDPVFIHYSQPSIQVDWLLESTVDGSTWLRRFSSFEADHNRMAKTRGAWLKALQDLGYSPQFLSSAQLESGALTKSNGAILILPESYAISDMEAAAIQARCAQAQPKENGFQLLTEGPCGCFDGHAKLRQKSLPGVFAAVSNDSGCVDVVQGRAVSRTSSRSLGYPEDRLKSPADSAWLDWLKEQLVPLKPDISVPMSAHVRVHRFRIKPGRLVAFERNIEYQMSEDLKQKGGNLALETPLATEADLREPTHVYDLRTGKYLGRTDRIQFTLDPWQPSLFALLREPLPAGAVLEALEKLSGPLQP